MEDQEGAAVGFAESIPIERVRQNKTSGIGVQAKAETATVAIAVFHDGETVWEIELSADEAEGIADLIDGQVAVARGVPK